VWAPPLTYIMALQKRVEGDPCVGGAVLWDWLIAEIEVTHPLTAADPEPTSQEGPEPRLQKLGERGHRHRHRYRYKAGPGDGCVQSAMQLRSLGSLRAPFRRKVRYLAPSVFWAPAYICTPLH
jgi:hypothetical protein